MSEAVNVVNVAPASRMTLQIARWAKWAQQEANEDAAAAADTVRALRAILNPRRGRSRAAARRRARAAQTWAGREAVRVLAVLGGPRARAWADSLS